MTGLNARANSALDDILAARAPGLNDLTRITLKMMVMDVLYAHARAIYTPDYPALAPLFEAWSCELAARTQVFMDTHDMVRKKQKELGTLAKQIAAEMEQRFTQRIQTPLQ